MTTRSPTSSTRSSTTVMNVSRNRDDRSRLQRMERTVSQCHVHRHHAGSLAPSRHCHGHRREEVPVWKSKQERRHACQNNETDSTRFLHRVHPQALTLYLELRETPLRRVGSLAGLCKGCCDHPGTALVANPLSGLLPTGQRRTASPLSDTYPECVRHKMGPFAGEKLTPTEKALTHLIAFKNRRIWMIESTLRGRGNLSTTAQ
jgi:hypothetical protein